MPWQACCVGTRVVVAALFLALTACSGEEGPGAGPDKDVTTDAECAERIPDTVFTTLGWTATGTPAESTVRGCHREAEQGYVEVRERAGDYGKLCSTLNRSGGVGPGLPPDWLTGVIACAVEPDRDVGQTKVLVKGDGDKITQVTIAVLTATAQAKVRAAVRDLVGH
jgi:predicted small lipoprotein YifL